MNFLSQFNPKTFVKLKLKDATLFELSDESFNSMQS